MLRRLLPQQPKGKRSEWLLPDGFSFGGAAADLPGRAYPCVAAGGCSHGCMGVSAGGGVARIECRAGLLGGLFCREEGSAASHGCGRVCVPAYGVAGIPYGETRTYGQLAAGMAGGRVCPRAVGRGLGQIRFVC